KREIIIVPNVSIYLIKLSKILSSLSRILQQNLYSSKAISLFFYNQNDKLESIVANSLLAPHNFYCY
ncbi:hypothetical protein, partial [Campylobacter jejuni]|uniref:hypothetical protein n=1 Tax=Campylobacter jejuni TaxID=197 RepID=UPI001BD96A93